MHCVYQRAEGQAAQAQLRRAGRKPDRTVLIFVIQEGRNRQIRRMCEEVELEVIRLKRTEIAGVKLGMLPQGKWRPLNEREMRHLTNVSTERKGN